ncbi:MAG: SCO family protein [Pseudomonadota bacterium]
MGTGTKAQSEGRSWRHHAVGVAMLLLTAGSLALIPLLPAKSETTLDLPFLSDIDADVVIVFAGFPGCNTSCPTALRAMATVYEQSSSPNTQLVFINIERDARDDLTTQYARAYHQSFAGVTLTRSTASLFARELGLRSFDSTRAALAHSNNIFVLRRESDGWHIAEVLRSSLQTQPLITSISRQISYANQ